MAVVTTKVTAITNRDSLPKALSNPFLTKADIHEAVGTLEAVSGDSIGSKYIMANVPSNARVSRMLLSCDAITTLAADIGIYKSTEDGGDVVDANFFATAQVLTSALKNLDVTHLSGVFGVENVEKQLWEALGETEDPNILYDIVLTLTAGAGAAGTVSFKAQYVV